MNLQKNSITITMDKLSVRKVARNLATMRSVVIQAAQAGVESVANEVYDNTDVTCPAVSGTLKSTIYKETEVSGNIISSNIGYGGRYAKINPITHESTDDYAIEVHEAPDRANRATWKWFEKAFNSVTVNAEQKIGNSIRSTLGG